MGEVLEGHVAAGLSREVAQISEDGVRSEVFGGFRSGGGSDLGELGNGGGGGVPA